jgi:hypothetical protein
MPPPKEGAGMATVGGAGDGVEQGAGERIDGARGRRGRCSAALVRREGAAE